MALLNTLIAEGKVCCCLRTKTMFYDTPDHDRPESLEAQKAGPFWCGETQSLIGPDGKIASLDACRRDRGCCSMA
jgi:hypothetical protein